jgi:hypothetical protein
MDPVLELVGLEIVSIGSLFLGSFFHLRNQNVANSRVQFFISGIKM